MNMIFTCLIAILALSTHLFTQLPIHTHLITHSFMFLHIYLLTHSFNNIAIVNGRFLSFGSKHKNKNEASKSTTTKSVYMTSSIGITNLLTYNIHSDSFTCS